MVMEIGEKGKGGKLQGDVPIYELSDFSLSASYPVVELAIAEMACVSSNVRRTFHVPSGVRVQRSISERDVSHPI